MLNSMSFGHFGALKLKTMIDLAIAENRADRYGNQQPPSHIPYPIQQHPAYPTPHHPPQPHPHHHHHQQQQPERKHILLNSQLTVTNNNKGALEDLIQASSREEELQHFNYSKSSQESSSSPKSQGSISPPLPNQGPLSQNLPSRGELYNMTIAGSGGSHHHPSSTLIPLLPPSSGSATPSAESVGEVHSVPSSGDNCGSGVKQNRRKHNVGGASKSSFSIESLLAHPSSWRGGPDGKAASKDSRFSPYPIQGQMQQNNRTSHRQPSEVSKTTLSTPSSQSEEKRNENFASGNKPGNGRRAAKSKRVRTIFTPEQLERLEAEFERQQYMVGPERLCLASSLYLTEAQVKVWFQNRRIKWRKQHLEMEQQRLAIYRTLVEQDLDVNPEDSVDCDYNDDEAGDTDEDRDHRRPPHSPPPPQTSAMLPGGENSTSCLGFGVKSPVVVDAPSLYHHHHYEFLPTQLKQVKPSASTVAAEHERRVPLQQATNNEDYDASTTASSLSSTASSSSSSSSSSLSCGRGNNVNQARREDDPTPSRSAGVKK